MRMIWMRLNKYWLCNISFWYFFTEQTEKSRRDWRARALPGPGNDQIISYGSSPANPVSHQASCFLIRLHAGEFAPCSWGACQKDGFMIECAICYMSRLHSPPRQIFWYINKLDLSHLIILIDVHVDHLLLSILEHLILPSYPFNAWVINSQSNTFHQCIPGMKSHSGITVTSLVLRKMDISKQYIQLDKVLSLCCTQRHS